MLAQILSILAMISMVLSYQMKERKYLLYWQMAANVFFAVSYYLLGAPTGALISLVNVLRCIVFSFKHTKWGSSRLWLYFFLAAALGAGIWTWEGPRSLLIIVATLLLTVALYSDNLRFSRIIFVIVPSLYVVYNILSSSIGGSLSDVFCLASALFAIWRFDMNHGKKEKAAGSSRGEKT